MEETKSEPLTTIGRCSCCEKMKKIVAFGRCGGCAPEPRHLTQEKVALIERRIKADPEFKRKCYELLIQPLAKKAFVESYGPVD